MVFSDLKGQSSTISTVLLAAVTITAVGVVLDASDDVLEDTQDYSTIQTAVDMMNSLDEDIREVSAEGVGSTRVQSIAVDEGEFNLDEENEVFWWEIETEAEPVSPQAQTLEGEVMLANNAGVEVYEEEGDDQICMENERTKVCIWAESMDPSDPEEISNDELIQEYEVAGQEREDDFDLDIWVNQDQGTSKGETWVEADKGVLQPRGRVEVHKRDGETEYTIQFVLYTGADFVSVTLDEP